MVLRIAIFSNICKHIL